MIEDRNFQSFQEWHLSELIQIVFLCDSSLVHWDNPLQHGGTEPVKLEDVLHHDVTARQDRRQLQGLCLNVNYN